MRCDGDLIPGFVNADGEVYVADPPQSVAPVVDAAAWVTRLRRKLTNPGGAWKYGGGISGVLCELREHGEDVEELYTVERQILRGPHGGMDPETHAAYTRWVSSKLDWIRDGIDAKLAEIVGRSG